MGDFLAHPTVSALSVAAAVALVGYLIALGHRITRSQARQNVVLASLEEDVLPWFRTPKATPEDPDPADLTLPHQLTLLRRDLTEHMAEEVRLRAAELGERELRQKKLDDVLDRLMAGNPEVRP